MSDIEKRERCLECGGDIEVNPRTGIPECIYCHRVYKSGVNSYDGDLQEIANQRQLREFIKAEELCEELLKAQPESCEAHWQALLAKLGVVYVEEDGRMKPTFFSCSYSEKDSVFDDEHYRAAIRYSDSADSRAFYEAKARELDSLLREFFTLVKKEANYDIFISFKHTVSVEIGGDIKTFETDDCKKAREIYEHLKGRYNVFFSPVSIGEDSGIQGEKYEPRILRALQTSQAMILVGFTEENLRAQWVENEWRRYKYFIDKGNKRKDSLIYVYEKNMRLPTALREIQLPNVDVFDSKYLEQLDKKLAFVQTKKGIKSSLTGKKLNTDFESSAEHIEYSTAPRVVISSKGSKQSIKVDSTEDRDLKTAYDMLSHGSFVDAAKRFNYVISRNPESHMAYYGLFMATVKARSEREVLASLQNASAKDLVYLEKTIENSPDEALSWSIVDKLMDGFLRMSDWAKQKPIFEFLIRYVDVPRIEKLHAIVGNICKRLVVAGKVKVSEEVFECAKGMFIEEVSELSIALMSDYASELMKASKFDVARKYLEQLAGAKNTSEAYFDLLAARLSTNDPTKVKLKLATNSKRDSVAKKVRDLDIDEIIERIVICDTRERASRVKGMNYKLYMPYYRVSVHGGSSVAAIISALRDATGYNVNEAKNFIAKYRVAEAHPTWIEASEVLEVLQSVGVDVEKIEQVERSGAHGLEPASKGQITSAVQYELGCSFDEAARIVSEKELFLPVYESKEAVDYALDKLHDVGVHDVKAIEDDPNKGIDLDAPTETYTKLCKMLMFQVYHNHNNVHPLMEIIISCYRELEDKKQLADTIFHVAEGFVSVKDFKQASIWYGELLIADDADARAHWGTLKCRLHATSDYEVAKHRKKLMDMQEFNNAINCANNEQHDRFMRVYYNEVEKPDKKAQRPFE